MNTPRELKHFFTQTYLGSTMIYSLQRFPFFSPPLHLLEMSWSSSPFTRSLPFIRHQSSCFVALQSLILDLVSISANICCPVTVRNEKLRHLCNYFEMLTRITRLVFSGVSLMTAAAMSVDRLLALSLGLRYRHIVTMKRVCAILSCFWFVCVAVSLMDRFWTRSSVIISKVVPTVIVLCIVTSVYCYTKIFFRLRRVTSSCSYARPSSSRATERRRNSKIPKDCFYSTVASNNIGRLPSSASFSENLCISFFYEWCFFCSRFKICNISYVLKFEFKPISLHMEDQRSEKSSGGHNQTVLLFY